MALPTAYLTSTKNLDGILSAIQTAQAPPRFTVAFLEGLGYKSSSDRLMINVLKSLDFLTSDGVPTERYYKFLDQIEAPKILGEALRDAYSEIYQLNRNAQSMSRAEVKNKLKTLTQGQPSDDVLGKMANTFLELAKRAEFVDVLAVKPPPAPATDEDDAAIETPPKPLMRPAETSNVGLGGLVYNIQIHLPESRERAVYDAIFRSLREHLI